MKRFIEKEKEFLMEVNGGNEYTYNKGYKVGEFLGKVGSMMDRFFEIFI